MADVITVEERDIREKRAKVFKGMSEIMEKQASGVPLTAEDRSDFDKRKTRLAELDGDLARVQDYNKLATVQGDIRDARQDTRGSAAVTGDPGLETQYEDAFLKFMRDGHTDGMTDTERGVFRAYSTPQRVCRVPGAKRHEQFYDTHGTKRDVGYEKMRTADILWDEQRTNDANALSTAPNSAGVSAGNTGYDAGYMVPQGSIQGSL